jgi:predicted RNA-binding Zn-ribbon protein involved in translation (DUF1610 family)
VSSDFVALQCPNCGGKLNVTPESASLRCPSCGGEYLVRREAGSVLLEGYARCPRCGRNDQVRIVSAILREQSALAAELVPPQAPAEVEPKITDSPPPLSLLFGVSGYILCGLVFFALVTGTDVSPTARAALVLVCIGLGLLSRRLVAHVRKLAREANEAAIRQAREETAQAAAMHRRAISRWQRLYYCARDDCVFVPGEGQSVPLAQMREYLYR